LVFFQVNAVFSKNIIACNLISVEKKWIYYPLFTNTELSWKYALELFHCFFLRGKACENLSFNCKATNIVGSFCLKHLSLSQIFYSINLPALNGGAPLAELKKNT